MNTGIKQIKDRFSDYSKVFENYFFMTLLPISSSLIGLLIYPYLIRTLGKESYGLYPYAVSMVSYFMTFISFGFGLPNIKKIVANKDSLAEKSKIVSSVFTAKFLLSIASSVIFLSCIAFIPFLYKHKIVFLLCYTQVFTELFFPIWYFQAVQKIRIVTIIQLAYRILTIPFILVFVKNPDDIEIYAFIVAVSVFLGAITSLIILWKKEGIILKFVPLKSLKEYFKDALPFFWSSSSGIIKQEGATLIIGSLFGMGEVALYDLANKIISIPRLLTNNINGALYPKIIESDNKARARKIICYEVGIGIFIMLMIALFGYWIVLLMGGESMLLSFPLAVILSTSVLTWLVVGGYINFIFIPQNHYYFVTYNQLVAMISFFVICTLGLLFYKSIFIVVIALSLSGFCEIIYCKYVTKKYRLLYDS